MRRLIASTPQAEVSGTAVQAMLQTLASEEIIPTLRGLGVESIDSDRWYSHQWLLDIYRDIEQNHPNGSQNMVAIGMKIIDAAALPPAISSVEDALQGIAMAYQLDHRNQTEKGWIVELAGPGKIIMTADNPYPAHLEYGIVWGLVRRFKPEKSQFTVKLVPPTDPEANPVYEVAWG